jgi:predicted RND superfamily exporter protein
MVARLLAAIGSRIDGFFAKLTPLQADRPWLFVLPGLLVALASVPLIRTLELRGDLTALLPEHAPAVVDLDEIQDRLGRATTLTIAVHGDSREDVRAVARALAENLESDVPDHVLSVDWNRGEVEQFVRAHKFLYADLGELREVRDALDERHEYEVAKASPFMVQLDDEEPPDFEELAERLERREREAEERLGLESGFFEHEDLPLVTLFVRTDIRIGDHGPGRDLSSEITRRLEAVRSELGKEDVRFDLGGDLMDSVAEAEALIEEVSIGTSVAIVLVLFSVYLFFLSSRSIPLLGLSLLAPVLATFAFAELTVDYLNSSSAFLGSIVVGNGINPNVIWLARYFEERREGTPVREAIGHTHKTTWAGTLTASLGAAFAYGSLMITDFRGFRDFGVIGGFGMVACWVGAVLFLPALAALFERVRPVRRREAARRNIYGAIFRHLALRSPRVVLVASLLLTVASGLLVYQFVASDPMEYDFRKLQSERDPDSRIQWVNDRQGEIVSESFTGSALALLVPDRGELDGVVSSFERLREEHPEVLGEIASIADFVPPEQEEKRAVLGEIRELLVNLRRFADEEEREQIDAHMPPEDIAVFGDADVPDTAARAFTEKDGTRGRVVYVGHDPAGNQWDGKFMVEWAGVARSVRLSDGARPPITGNAAVFADLLTAIFVDAPKAVGLALLVTCALLILSFRKWRDRFTTLVTLLVGVLWMTGAIAFFKIKINFLNFLAFPITFGNGVDYAVNLMQRHGEEEGHGSGAVARAVEATGGAVVLNALTTVLGYVSLYASSNQALNSFGAAMTISELTCVVAAIVALPAFLSLHGAKKRARAENEPAGSTTEQEA